MNWFGFNNGNFGGGFSRSNYGGGFNGGVRTGWGGNSGAVQGANNGWGGGYSGNTQTLSSLNTQPMDYRYGAIGTDNNTANNMSWGYGTGGQGGNPYVQFRPGAIGFGFNGGGNADWGRPDESGRYKPKPQPYNRFLVEGFNPGFEQYGVLGVRLDRQARERTIDRLGQVGFWQASNPNYPLNLYNG